ncbi:uncharacterized protein LOC131655928 [Vicia villosa]|uniref:uncharacterized protein LOC131655928 n=1 Tax=Vicia villosa TaxID=3911 RepID=UPI00273BBEC2|nr:uncharacterized protein LOC131655928 [Vicia villosa]
MKRNCYFNSLSQKPMNEESKVNKHLVIISHELHEFDDKEFQARVIIWLANQEMEGRNGRKKIPPTLSLSLQPQVLLMHASHGFSIKQSLQIFLQKRKRRIQSHASIITCRDSNGATN